jgi:RPA family protein
MKQDFDDCFDEISDIDNNIIDYKVLKDIKQNKQKIKKQNKKIKNKNNED